MTAAGSGDAWRISGEDRAKHDSQFFSLKPVNGFVTGDQARGFFMQSGLPTPVLGQIWSLADMNNDGKMDKKEFSIAMHLIKKRLQGYEIPKSLPPSLKADPSPVMGSFGVMGAQPPVMGVPPMGMGMAPGMPMMANGMAPMPGYGAQIPVSTGYPGQVRPQVAPGASGAGFAMPHQSKLKYTQLFNSNDHHKRGTLTGVEARSILVQTGVPQQMLAQIWNLSDIDKDGKLDCDEFCIAMHLIDMVKIGQILPAKLPAELMPNKARSGSFGPTPTPVPSSASQVQPKDSFGDLLGTMGMPAPVQPAPVTNGDAAKIDEQVTFEDRRKENFDKGQAELERRRQMLQDQMKREQEARLQKERDEQEKRDKIRREQEMKKQQAMERQLEKQRELERQKEEQRQKMMEQREAARRELERQRQMEWERQRKEQLMAEKTREYEQLTTLKAQTSNLKCELESLQEKKKDTSLKISQVKNGLNDFTAHIEAMRSTRDLKNKDIDQLQAEIQSLNQQLLKVQSEKSSLDLKVQTSLQSNPMSETHRTMMHSVELKKTSVQRLKKDLEAMEKETETRLADIDTLNTQNADLQKAINKLQADISVATNHQKDTAKFINDQSLREKDKNEKLRKELEAQRLREETQKKQVETSQDTDSKWFDFGGDVKPATTTASSTNDNWASVFDTQAVSQASSVAWDSAFSSQPAGMKKSESSNFKLTGPTKQYKALYQFDARNLDELSLLPGDIVMVYDDQTGAEPEWIGGEMNGKRGWFPEAYVEKVPEESSQSASWAADTSTLGLSSSEDSSFMAVQGKVPAVSPTPGQGKTAPEGLQAQALYPWKAKKDNHLTFNKGDIINVKEQQDMWWSGDFGGKTGWFPKSYVKMVSGPSIATPPIMVSDSSSPMGMLEKVSSALGSARQSPAPMDKTLSDNTYVAVYTYQSTEPGDLTFNQGDTIIVTEMDGDWWTGTLGSVSGIFPANYVKKQEPQSVTEGQDPFPAADTQIEKPSADPFSAFANFPESGVPELGVSIPSSGFSCDPFVSEGQNTDWSLNSGMDAFAPDNVSSSSTVNKASTSLNNDQFGNIMVNDPFKTETQANESDQDISVTPDTNDLLSTGSTQMVTNVALETIDKEIANINSLLVNSTDVSNTSPFPNVNTSETSPFPNVNTKENSDDMSDTFGGDPFGNDGQTGSISNVPESAMNIDPISDPFATFSLGPASPDEIFAGGFPDTVTSPVSIESLEKDSTLASSSDLEIQFGSWGLSDTLTSSSQTTQSLNNLPELGNDKAGELVVPLRRKQNSQSDDKKPGPPLPAKTYLVNAPPSNMGSGMDTTGSTDTDLPNQSTDSTDTEMPYSSEFDSSDARSSTGTLKKPEIATVIAAYTATGTEQLSLSPGQLIQVRKKSPSGWWEGELQARGQKRKIGWFPANYVKLLGSSARNTPDNTLVGGSSPSVAMFNNASPAPHSVTPQPPSQPAAQTYIDHVIAIYPYAAQHPDELTFQKDSVINVTKKDDPDWWQGECNGETGMFPSNYVTSTTPESTS